MREDSEVTKILERLAAGHREDLDRLLTVIYDELRALAARHLRLERADHTLQPTALVHEAFLRLVDQRDVGWSTRAHFFATAAEIIRRILVDHARAHKAVKRGGDRRRLTLSSVALADPQEPVDILALEEAMQTLARIDPRQARIVDLRFYGGLTVEEVAEVLGMGKRSVDREWRCARTWLYTMLRDDQAALPTRGAEDGPEPRR